MRHGVYVTQIGVWWRNDFSTRRLYAFDQIMTIRQYCLFHYKIPYTIGIPIFVTYIPCHIHFILSKVLTSIHISAVKYCTTAWWHRLEASKWVITGMPLLFGEPLIVYFSIKFEYLINHYFSSSNTYKNSLNCPSKNIFCYFALDIFCLLMKLCNSCFFSFIEYCTFKMVKISFSSLKV